jgi:aryl-alcohol dehydrogenase-like predicted oxidoreductase
MRYVEVNGARLSVIGVGTWQFGSKDWAYGTDYAQNEAGSIVNRALDLGVNLIDTAEIYGRNESERIVGRASTRRQCSSRQAAADHAAGIDHRRRGARRGGLSIGVVDLCQIQPSWRCRFRNRCGNASARRRGVVAHVGVSNFRSRGGAPPARRFAGAVDRCSTAWRCASPTPSSCLHRGERSPGNRGGPLAKGLLSGRWRDQRRGRRE